MPKDSPQKAVSFNAPQDELFSRQGSRESPENNDGDVPRTKRIACVVCRRRKLRCDGVKPSCGTCSRLGHDCAYDEVRRKSGPKRGYVKALEARLAQVESLLKTQDGPTTPHPGRGQGPYDPVGDHGAQFAVPRDLNEALVTGLVAEQEAIERAHLTSQSSEADFSNMTEGIRRDPSMDIPPHSAQQMISLEMDEALPPQDIIDDLTNIFFEKCYHVVPMIHKARYLASLQRAPAQRPPICLRYAMWALAATSEEKYLSYRTHFYRKARKAIDEMELIGHGEKITSIAAIQTWNILGCYEFKLMYFPRAWMSTGRAARLSQMMGLQRVDSSAADVKQCLPEPVDWIEKEERRRVFWVAFAQDRYASIGTGWPMALDERDIITCLPCSDEIWLSAQPEPPRSFTLQEAMTPEGAAYLTPFNGVLIMSAVFGRNLLHLHRPDGDQNFSDTNCDFWVRHRHLDNLLMNIAMSLPHTFRLPNGIEDQNIVFTNMNLHAATICLHQAAIFKAEKYGLASTTIDESKMRSASAAQQIASIMRMVSHFDFSGFNPFLSFCLYVAARVFVQCLKFNPNDYSVKSSIEFLLMALRHMRKINPLTESFLLQLEVDLTGYNLDTPASSNRIPFALRKGDVSILPSRTGSAATGGANNRKTAEPENASDCGANFGKTIFPHCTASGSVADELKSAEEKRKIMCSFGRDDECGTNLFFGSSKHTSVESIASESLSPQNSNMATPDSRGFTPQSTDNSTGRSRSQGTSASGYSPMEIRQEDYQLSINANITGTLNLDFSGTLNLPTNTDEYGNPKDYGWDLMDEMSGHQQQDPSHDPMTIYSDLF